MYLKITKSSMKRLSILFLTKKTQVKKLCIDELHEYGNHRWRQSVRWWYSFLSWHYKKFCLLLRKEYWDNIFKVVTKYRHRISELTKWWLTNWQVAKVFIAKWQVTRWLVTKWPTSQMASYSAGGQTKLLYISGLLFHTVQVSGITVYFAMIIV